MRILNRKTLPRGTGSREVKKGSRPGLVETIASPCPAKAKAPIAKNPHKGQRPIMSSRHVTKRQYLKHRKCKTRPRGQLILADRRRGKYMTANVKATVRMKLPPIVSGIMKEIKFKAKNGRYRNYNAPRPVRTSAARVREALEKGKQPEGMVKRRQMAVEERLVRAAARPGIKQRKSEARMDRSDVRMDKSEARMDRSDVKTVIRARELQTQRQRSLRIRTRNPVRIAKSQAPAERKHAIADLPAAPQTAKTRKNMRQHYHLLPRAVRDPPAKVAENRTETARITINKTRVQGQPARTEAVQAARAAVFARRRESGEKTEAKALQKKSPRQKPAQPGTKELVPKIQRTKSRVPPVSRRRKAGKGRTIIAAMRRREAKATAVKGIQLMATAPRVMENPRRGSPKRRKRTDNTFISMMLPGGSKKMAMLKQSVGSEALPE